MKKKPEVGIILGSERDLPAFGRGLDYLDEFGVPYEVLIASAHRTPRRAMEYAEGARKRGLKVLIAGAGAAAHLAGALAANSTLPVLGVPLDATPLKGFDALLSTVQMPAGVPVATLAIGESGAANAALFAVSILALSDPALEKKWLAFKKGMADQVEEKNRKLKNELAKRKNRS